MTGTATAGTTKFSWSDHRTIAHALGGLDGRDYLNSREGFLAMYQQGVRLFELDLSRTSDGVGMPAQLEGVHGAVERQREKSSYRETV